jgi:hypothetical protein
MKDESSTVTIEVTVTNAGDSAESGYAYIKVQEAYTIPPYQAIFYRDIEVKDPILFTAPPHWFTKVSTTSTIFATSFLYGVWVTLSNPDVPGDRANIQVLSPFNGTIGGVVIPVDKLGLLAPYISLTLTTVVGAVAATISVKCVKRRKKKDA